MMMSHKKNTQKIDGNIEIIRFVRKRKDDDCCRVLFSVCNNCTSCTKINNMMGCDDIVYKKVETLYRSIDSIDGTKRSKRFSSQ